MSLIPPASGTLSPRISGRLAGVLYVGSGVLTILYLFLPTPPVVNRNYVLVVAAAAIVCGIAIMLVPWDRFPPKTTLALLPLAYALIALGNVYGTIDPSAFGVFFIVAFVWTGLSHPRGTSVWFTPMAVVAYVVPMIFRPAGSADATSAAIIIPVGVLVGETLSWIREREERSRDSARALARASHAVASNLNKETLLQTLVDETRTAVRAQHAALFEVEPDTLLVKRIYASGLGRFVDEFNSLAGNSYASFEGVRELFNSRAPVVISDTRVDHGYPRDFIDPFGVKSFMSVPVIVEDRVVGAITVAETSRRRQYSRGDVSLFAALAHDAEIAIQNSLLYERALELARRDPLTGLSNRREFHERLTGEVERARRTRENLSVVVLDIDGFKKTNDTWGHLAGDRVLQRFARFLVGVLRHEDDVYRLGGDEFALILPETTSDGAVALAERLRRIVERARLGGAEGKKLTLSVGVATLPDHAKEPDELIERADSALRDVKLAGRDAVGVSSNGSRGSAAYPVDVRKIIEHGLLRPIYQPIVSPATGEVFGYEALAQLDPEIAHIPIRTIFRAAGPLGMVTALDRACRNVVLEGAGDFPSDKLFFLNASPALLANPDFAVETAAAVAVAGIDPAQTVIEITETERSPEFPQLVHKLGALWRYGFRVALDDFSGEDLALLANLAFDYVKIDIGLLHESAAPERRRRVLAGLHRLVTETGAKTISEGVETDEDYRLVSEIGFDGAQGFMVGRPEPHPAPPLPAPADRDDLVNASVPATPADQG